MSFDRLPLSAAERAEVARRRAETQPTRFRPLIREGSFERLDERRLALQASTRRTLRSILMTRVF